MRTFDRITTYVAAFGVVLSALSFAVSVDVGIGALVGTTIALTDWLATRFLGAWLLTAGERGRTLVSLALGSKMALVLGVCAAVLSTGHVSALGLMIGISAMVAGIIVGGLHGSMAPVPAVPGNVAERVTDA